MYHFTKDSRYKDYIELLASLKLFGAVLDRHALCEFPYHLIMGRPFKFSFKEWHNIILLTLAYKPLIILCTHKPIQAFYSKEQYLPYAKWDNCLALYRYYLNSHHIPHIEYDYSSTVSTEWLHDVHNSLMESALWWEHAWAQGYGFIGAYSPKVLLVAERLGPNNIHYLPFETGPTGKMLSDMLYETGTPLGKFAVTNIVKAELRSERPPNSHDMELFIRELGIIQPEKIVFMGTVARSGEHIAKRLGIPYTEMVHFGYYSHKHITDMTTYHAKWRDIVGITA